MPIRVDCCECFGDGICPHCEDGSCARCYGTGKIWIKTREESEWAWQLKLDRMSPAERRAAELERELERKFLAVWDRKLYEMLSRPLLLEQLTDGRKGRGVVWNAHKENEDELA